VVLPAAAAAAVLWAACSGASTPLKPLSSLGKLQPAPFPGTLGPELVPIPAAPPLAPAASKATFRKTVDGIRCQRNEKLVSHHHVHLTLFVNGKQRKVPAGIGIWPPLQPQGSDLGSFVVTEGNCFSWLTTHLADGIIHVETPVKRSFVLGELFDIWGQPLGRSRLGPANAAVTAIVNGKVWTGDPRRIPLLAHSQIQLEAGTPLVAPEKIRFYGSF
jgi:hypothetical protein